MDIDNLKLQISSVQAERDRLLLLISEYVRDISSSREQRTIKSRKEVL